MPSGTAIRRGTIVAVPLSLMLLSGAPAFAATLAPGDPCTTSSTLDAGLTCVDGIVTDSAAPAPSASPSSSDTVPTPEASATPDTTTPSQLPVAGDPGGTAPAPASGGTATGTTGGGTPNGTTGGLSAGTTSPSVAGPSAVTPVSSTSPAVTSTSDGPGVSPAQATGAGAQSASATTLLGAADLVLAPPGDLPSLGVRSVAVRRVLDPGAVQAPELAGMPLGSMPLASLPPAQAVSAVQGPLLAVGQQAAGAGGFHLLGLTSHTLPGILIALATATVAAVGAGNVRAWQTRLAARRYAGRRRPQRQPLAS